MNITPNQAAQIYWALRYQRLKWPQHAASHGNYDNVMADPTTGVASDFRFSEADAEKLMDYFKSLAARPVTGVEKGLFDGVKSLLMDYADLLWSAKNDPDPKEYTSAIINQLLVGLWLQAQMEGLTSIPLDWLLSKREFQRVE